jgi:hypothetical protein
LNAEAVVFDIRDMVIAVYQLMEGFETMVLISEVYLFLTSFVDEFVCFDLWSRVGVGWWSVWNGIYRDAAIGWTQASESSIAALELHGMHSRNKARN